jgi:hypothetical protein
MITRDPVRNLTALATLVFLALVGLVGPAAGASPEPRPFTLSQADLQIGWGVTKAQEIACGAPGIAGGSTVGEAVFAHLGRASVEVSAAWDIDHLISDPQYHPVGPAGGPVAPVLGPGDYPYAFHFDPKTGQCGSGPTATGQIRITAANGDEVDGRVTGGETFRLDFSFPGDGVETFLEVEITGGTGRFAEASGSFVAHTITRFNPVSGASSVDLAELLPGGTISY